ncbi:hypothetical protein D3C78_1644130 [compost metagenome]
MLIADPIALLHIKVGQYAGSLFHIFSAGKRVGNRADCLKQQRHNLMNVFLQSLSNHDDIPLLSRDLL